MSPYRSPHRHIRLMIAKSAKRIALLIVMFAGMFLVLGCENNDILPSSEAPTTQPTATQIPITPTPEPPTPTPVPLAAIVNGEGITLEEYEAELERARTGAGTNLATNLEELVLDELVDQVLLAQAAVETGFMIDEAGLQTRYDALAAGMGGTDVLTNWLMANGYREENFRQALKRSAQAAWMRDQIAAGVPDTAEQIHARQILLSNSNEASSLLTQLKSGADFESLAKDYDPVAGGDLGWFPHGYLTQPALEEAVFALQPGEISDIIESQLGFHIVQVIDRDSQRILDPEAKLVLQTAQIRLWLNERRNTSEIQIVTPQQ